MHVTAENSDNADFYTFVSFDEDAVSFEDHEMFTAENLQLSEAYHLRSIVHSSVNVCAGEVIKDSLRAINRKRHTQVINGVVGLPSITSCCQKLSIEKFHAYCFQVADIDQSGPCRTACLNKLRILHQQYLLFKSLNIDIEKEILSHKGRTWADLPRSNIGVNASRFMSRHALTNEISSALGFHTDSHLNNLFADQAISQISPESLGLSIAPAKRNRFQNDSFQQGKLKNSDSVRALRKYILDYESPYMRRAMMRTLKNADKSCLLRLSIDYFADRENEWRKIMDFIDFVTAVRPGTTFSLQIFGDKLQASTRFNERLQQIFEPFWNLYTGMVGCEKYEPLFHIQSLTIVYPDASESEDDDMLTSPQTGKCISLSDVAYFIWLNVQTLNVLRTALIAMKYPIVTGWKNNDPIRFCVSCSNDMDMASVASSYLLADTIFHPRVLSVHPVLSYLMYIHQVPLVFSTKGRDRGSHSFVNSLLSIGSQVFLCSDNSLQKYFSEDPLQEEYDNANQIGMFDAMDIHEMCLNSLQQTILSAGLVDFDADQSFYAIKDGIDTKILASLKALMTLLKGRRTFRQSAFDREMNSLNIHRTTVAATSNHTSPQARLSGLTSNWHTKLKPTHMTSATRDATVENFRRVVIFPKSSKSSLEYQKDLVIREPKALLTKQPPLAEMVYTMLSHAMALRIKYMKDFYGKNLINETNGLPLLPVLSFLLSGSHTLRNSGILPQNQNSGKPHPCENERLAFERVEGVKHPRLLSAHGSRQTGLFGCPICASSIPSPQEYYEDYTKVRRLVENPIMQHFSMRRLNVLHAKFELHCALNKEAESKKSPTEHRDLYRTVKVDTHVHLVAGMTAKELLDYMKEQFLYHGDDIIDQKNGTTLASLQKALGIHDVKELTVDSLDVQADRSIWKRFDNFNSKYNPLRESALRSLFLKYSNGINGRYLAEMTKRVFLRNIRDSHTFTEFRVSIYGRKSDEWRGLAQWFASNGMASVSNKFLIQVPRIYHVYRKQGEIRSYAEFLENIFLPLWRVSKDPMLDPELHHFLQHVSGFDSVDNESELDTLKIHADDIQNIYPEKWVNEENPPYWYWMYYMHINIRLLNGYREAKGLSTFSFRPHCGESGATSHLIDGLLLTSGISHGINLRKSAPLQYMYFLSQLGVAISPLSNNALWLEYMKNPFPSLFRRGLAVSLSSDDPLVFHHTSQPLIEEYAIASKIYNLTPTDTCEIAKTSVLTSGFDDSVKRKWLGEQYYFRSSIGNSLGKSHVPNARCAFRFETFHDEIRYLHGLRAKSSVDEEPDAFPLGILNIDQEKKFFKIIESLRRTPQTTSKI